MTCGEPIDLLVMVTRKDILMKRVVNILVAVMLLALTGCAGMTDTQQRTLSGAAIGTAGGAAIGALSGNAGWGAAIGAAAGAGGGYLYDKNQKAKEDAYRRGYEEGKQQ